MRGTRLPRALAGAIFSLMALGVPNAAAQVDYEIIAALQFNFSNPGARSLALAGALTGAGDDATGAWTNPGGLTNISRPEVGFEFRGFDFSTLFVNGGRFNGSPSGFGADTINGLTAGESVENTYSLSFVSAVVPRSRWAVAFYRNEAANFQTAIETDGAFYDEEPSTPNEFNRLFPAAGGLDITIANIGGAVAVRLSDQVSLGVGLSVYDFSLDSALQRFGLRAPGLGPGSFLGPALRTSANAVATEIIEGDDTAFGVNVGASINPNPNVRFGASFRQGPKFDIAYTRLRGDGSLDASGTSEFQVPDVFAAGALILPADSLRIVVDYRRVRYSQLTKGMVVVITPDVDSPSDFVVDDANEIRAGGEYLVRIGASVLALRGGFWFDPDHRIRFEGRSLDNRILYPAGDDEMHYTGGAGVVINNALQLDAGYDHSDRVKTFSVSAIYRF